MVFLSHLRAGGVFAVGDRGTAFQSVDFLSTTSCRSFYLKKKCFKHVSCEFDQINGRYSSLQAA